MSLVRFLEFVLLLSLSSLALTSAADDDGTWTYSLSGDKTIVTGCVATCPTDMVIPSTIDGIRNYPPSHTHHMEHASHPVSYMWYCSRDNVECKIIGYLSSYLNPLGSHSICICGYIICICWLCLPIL